MIKRIIFDVDMTLLNTYKDCIDTYFEVYQNIDEAKKIYDAFEKYDATNGNYNKQDVVSFINNELNNSFTINDFNKICDTYKRHATMLNEEVSKALQDLSKDYELVALSKWYLDDQTSRLKKANIYNYFKKIYAIGNGPIKPSKEAFINACGNYKYEECLMIGDSIENDINPAKELNIKTILFNPDNKQTNYLSVSSLTEIKNIIKKEEL